MKNGRKPDKNGVGRAFIIALQIALLTLEIALVVITIYLRTK